MYVCMYVYVWTIDEGEDSMDSKSPVYCKERAGPAETGTVRTISHHHREDENERGRRRRSRSSMTESASSKEDESGVTVW